jgi:hypothetical protein
LESGSRFLFLFGWPRPPPRHSQKWDANETENPLEFAIAPCYAIERIARYNSKGFWRLPNPTLF